MIYFPEKTFPLSGKPENSEVQMNDNERCRRGRKIESLVLAAEPRAAGVNCVNGNEAEEAADARVPLQSKSHQPAPPTETLRDILAPWRWNETQP